MEIKGGKMEEEMGKGREEGFEEDVPFRTEYTNIVHYVHSLNIVLL